jgi:endonuclease/exonuclease/phosphatase family metal-dependent hydrolase
MVIQKFGMPNIKKMMKIKKLLFSSAVVLLILLPGCSGKNDENSIKVLTLNVAGDNPVDSLNAWSERASIITIFIKNEKPDLIGMQEVLFHQYQLLSSVLEEYSSSAAGSCDGARSGNMNPVFFRNDKFDLVRSKTFWLSENPEEAGSKAWETDLPYIVTWIELADKKSHEHLFLFNTQFPADSVRSRIKSADLLLNTIDSISSGFPFIVTGDFNMLMSGEEYKLLTGPFESVPLLLDSYLTSDRRHTGPAYTYNGFSDTTRAGRVDYIFVKNGINVRSNRTVIRKSHGIYISDHWPVEAVLSLK